jgi:hypothetical protein
MSPTRPLRRSKTRNPRTKQNTLSRINEWADPNFPCKGAPSRMQQQFQTQPWQLSSVFGQLRTFFSSDAAWKLLPRSKKSSDGFACRDRRSTGTPSSPARKLALNEHVITTQDCVQARRLAWFSSKHNLAQHKQTSKRMRFDSTPSLLFRPQFLAAAQS